MICDMRTYDLKPGCTSAYMDAVRELALPVRQDYGVILVGWYFTEVGVLNQIVHIWAYRDWSHMETAKQSFRNDDRWIKQYLPRVKELIVTQRNQIMQAADVSPPPVRD